MGLAMMRVEASAPSNIALIKYMGKTPSSGNIPTNASLSYTLEHLRSFVTIEDAATDAWLPLEGLPALELSEKGRAKFLGHFRELKNHWNVGGAHLLRSANNFPSDCGLASSASSFAALTLATYELAKRQGLATAETPESLSKLARKGSGSSCRSLFTPWAIWRNEGAEALDLGLRLEHAVLIAGAEKKQVSSSEAHSRVTSSLLFEGRARRAEKRLDELVAAFRAGEWREACELCWNEFWDMHALFESSRPPFGYMNGETLKILNRLREVWNATGDGPLVTMDAGANVHILLRPGQTAAADIWLKDFPHQKSWQE
jgi:diphosphomevalonate decarboxylase